ncbi:MAG: hypothetical protein II089_13290, partial [Selenomonas sp.]|nr:hypothetical protein [Selenomonas sp.]
MTTKKNTRRPHGDGSIYHDEKKGRWIAQYNVGYDGKTGRTVKRIKACRTQKAARAALEELALKYANPGALEADHLTVEKWLTNWFEIYSRPQIREDTAASYLHMLKFAIDAIGSMPLGDVN